MNICLHQKRVTLLAGWGYMPYVPIVLIAGMGAVIAASVSGSETISSGSSNDPMTHLLNLAQAGGPWALMAALLYAVRYMTRRTEDTSKLLVDVLTTTVRASNEAIIKAQESSNQTHAALRDVLSALQIVSANNIQMSKAFEETRRDQQEFRKDQVEFRNTLTEMYRTCSSKAGAGFPARHLATEFNRDLPKDP